MSTISSSKKGRKVMKAQKKKLLWDENGNLIDRDQFPNSKASKTTKISQPTNNSPAKTEPKSQPKRKRTKAEIKKANDEYLALIETVKSKKNKNKTTEIKKPVRAASVGDFGSFLKRQNDSAKKHIHQPSQETQKKFKYSNKKSQVLTKNRPSSVSTPRPSRANSVVVDRSYIREFEDEYNFKDSDAASVRGKPNVKFNPKHFERLDRQRLERIEKQRQQILKEQEIKPRIVRRNPDMKKLEELAKPKTQRIVTRQSQRNQMKINKDDVVTPSKSLKSKKVPVYVSEVRTIFKSFKYDLYK